MSNKRLFIAAEIPVEARKAVYQLGFNVLKNCDDARSVKVNNLHITLKFLGNIPLDNIDLINSAITDTASSFNNFSFEIDGRIDAFPNKKRARTIYSVIGEGRSEFKLLYLSLKESLERACRRFGIKNGSNDFIAHITIARLRHPEDINYAINEAGTISPMRIECKNMALFESILESTGVRYTKLREFSLK
ncbi:RNA 2',3'-cyclic phosphodiesterase [Actinomycetota bacterium]